MRIQTDHKWKLFRFRNDVPTRVLADQFDYQSPDVVEGFIHYRKRWYHIDEFMRVDKGGPLAVWHGYAPDSFFSGVVIRVSSDGEMYQIGTYYS